jgi:hypothetical protein
MQLSRKFIVSSAVAICVMSFLSGCANVQEQVNATIHGINEKAASMQPKAAPHQNQPASDPAAAAQGIVSCSSQPLSSTALAGVFAKTSSRSSFPRVSITVTNWANSDCWEAKAKLWSSATKSQTVGIFSVPLKNTLTSSVGGAVNYQLFMRQITTSGTGDVRTEGPRPPMLAYPSPDPFGTGQYGKSQEAVAFIRELVHTTGWQPGMSTTLWVAKFTREAAKPAASQAAAKSTIPVLESFKTCDVKSMPNAPINLANGLAVTQIKSEPAFKGQTRVVLTLNKSPVPGQENPIGMLKRMTGYDFTKSMGAVDFEYDESGEGAPNWVACLKT